MQIKYKKIIKYNWDKYENYSVAAFPVLLIGLLIAAIFKDQNIIHATLSSVGLGLILFGKPKIEVYYVKK